MKTLILTALFFTFTQAQTPKLNCDAGQIENSTKTHSSQIVMQSIQEIFSHFYQNAEAYSLPPYQLLKHGEMQGYATVANPKSKGKNSFVTNLELAQNSQYYVDCKNPNNNTLCQNPPTYTWGGMGWYERNDKNQFFLNLHGNDEMTSQLSKGHPGLDCSGFTYAVFSNAKLRVTMDLNLTPSFETADNTPARSYMNFDAKSCFKELPTSKKPENSLMPGDIIVWKTHMLLVDATGKDPFGINHIASSSGCNIANVRPENATMTIVNSKGGFNPHDKEILLKYGKNSYFNQAHKAYLDLTSKNASTGIGIGISREFIKEFYYTSPDTFFSLAINFCKAKFTKKTTLPNVKIIRHKAFFPKTKAPCECFARQQDYLELRP